jgi:excisionase family DNA binding protein
VKVVWAITRVIVLRSDPIPKQEVNVDRSRKGSVFLPHDKERPIDGTSSADEGGPAVEPLVLKAGDVAKLLGLGRSKVFAMLALGELPVIRMGRSVRVPRAALEDWIAEHTQDASGRREDAGPLSAEVEDRNRVPGASPSPQTRGVPREPILGRRQASPKASSGASS